MIKRTAVLLAVIFAAIPLAAQWNDKKPGAYDRIIGGEAEKKAKEVPQYTYLYDTSLIRAIKKNDDDRIRTLLYANVDPNERNDEGFTPLVLAAERVSPEMIQMMLQRNARVNTPSLYNITPLMAAAAAGRPDIVQLFLEYGANPNVVDDLGMSPLMHAAKNKHSNVVSILAPITKIDINTRDKSNTNPVIYAAENRDVESMKALGYQGADVNAKDTLGRTPLMIAAGNGDLTFVRELLNLNASLEDKDNTGRTALMYAVQGGYDTIASLLISHGANIETTDLVSTTPVILAAKGRYNKIVKDLVKLNADLSAQDKLGRTALTWAVDNNDYATFNAIIDSPAIDANVTYGQDNITPLMSAADQGDYRMVSTLVTKRGAKVNAADIYGRTPLYFAMRSGDQKTVDFLLKNGADKAALLAVKDPGAAKEVRVEPAATGSAFWDSIEDIDAYIADLENKLSEAKKVKAERDAKKAAQAPAAEKASSSAKSTKKPSARKVS